MSQVTDQIKERIDLIDLIREYIPELKKAGISWKARCPFHQEKTPSFVVSPDKGIWHCFGCHEGGDMFAFVKKSEGIEFPDALRLLAKRAGVKLEAIDRREESERSRVLDILQLASRWYHEALLKAKSADMARDYITKRGLSEKTIAEWQLGFAPEAWDTLLKYLTSRGWREKAIANAGLAIANDRGGYYDRFRYRLIFPITDVHGAVVGFTARRLKEDDPSHEGGASVGGKYINTPETLVYHKSQVFYGLSKAKKEIRVQDLAVVVEGNMDCISSHQAGFTNVVASSGTALTPEQVKLLKRFTKNIVLAFDPDAAGQAALVRGLEVAWQEDMIVRMASLPQGLDPDALIKKDPNEWRSLIQNAPSFMDWLLAKTEKDNDLTTAIGKKEAGRILLPWIARLPDAIEQTHYLQILAGKIRVGEDVLREVISRSPRATAKTGPRRAGAPDSGQATKPGRPDVLMSIATRLAALVLLLPDKTAFWASFSFDWLPDPELSTLYKNLNFFYDSHTTDSKDSWLTQLPEELQSLGRSVALLAEELAGTLDKDQSQMEIDILRSRLRAYFTHAQLKALREQIKDAELAGDEAAVDRLMRQWQQLSQDLPS